MHVRGGTAERGECCCHFIPVEVGALLPFWVSTHFDFYRLGETHCAIVASYLNINLTIMIYVGYYL